MPISDLPASWLPIADAVLKATILLAAAAAASVAFRNASAALRHLVWTLALCAALAVPALSVALPRWQLPLVTVATSADAAIAPAPGAAVPRTPAPALRGGAPVPARARQQDSLSRTPAHGAAATQHASATLSAGVAGLSWPSALLAIWAFGALLIVARVLAGIAAVQWMSYRTERVFDAPWLPMARALAAEAGVSPHILFLRSRSATMPMAWGIVLPTVMMPADADSWPAERLRIVLLHELAHVKRRDCLTHLLAQLACAVYWFHPLAWMAARKVRTERERACDDLVLAAGTRGSDYADQLLEIARVMRDTRFPAVLAGASLAMAHRSQLEGRLVAILDPRVPRTGPSRPRAAAVAIVCAMAVVPLAAVQPWTEAAAVPSADWRNAAAVAEPQGPQTPTPAPTPAPAPAPAPAPLPPAEDAQSRAAAPLARIAAEAAADALDAVADGGVIESATEAAVEGAMDALMDQDGKQVDPRLVAALTEALKDVDKEVRAHALHALAQIRDPAVFEPLVQALKDAAADVREQAAHGLGQMRDRRAVQPLVEALEDENASVREQAAHALGQLRDRSAAPALSAALKDSNPGVREQAVHALGQLRDPATIDGLTVALKDSNADVREQAAHALGQLRDRRTLGPLISALKDPDADVREQAAHALGQLGDRGAVEALVIAMRDENASVREQVAHALGRIRDDRAIDALTAALKDPSASVRQQAAHALGQLAR